MVRTMAFVNRRLVLSMTLSGLGFSLMKSALGADSNEAFESACELLEKACSSQQVHAASIYIRVGSKVNVKCFGEAKTDSAAFLLGSISKPIAITSLMVLFDQGKFSLDDPAQKFLPEFKGDGREQITIRHLLTHVSGLPDQLPDNAKLRGSHAPLSEFVRGALRVPLSFSPGTRYQYSSMAILLATEIAQRISGTEIKRLVRDTVLKPLNMNHSALGVGDLANEQIMKCQVEFGAVESGGGSAESRSWDWNSDYWRQLGAPWGGVQSSANDVGLFLEEFAQLRGVVVKPETAKLMTRNHNPLGRESRGLGFEVGMEGLCAGCSVESFGHTGSTGTIAWADPSRERVCVVLTTLPGQALPAQQHPRQIASNFISS